MVTRSCLACAPSSCPVCRASFLTLTRHFQGALFKISDFEVRGFFLRVQLQSRFLPKFDPLVSSQSTQPSPKSPGGGAVSA